MAGTMGCDGPPGVIESRQFRIGAATRLVELIFRAGRGYDAWTAHWHDAYDSGGSLGYRSNHWDTDEAAARQAYATFVSDAEAEQAKEADAGA